MVVAIAHEIRGSNVHEAVRRQLEAQADGLGADAIIDVRLQMEAVNAPGRPDGLAIALIGTAIKFLQKPADAPPYVAG